MIIEQKERTISNSQSPIQFSLPPTGHWKVWYRYLTIAGTNVLNTGNVCSTCCCYFEYLPGDKKDNIAIAEEFSETLNAGLNSLDDKTLQQAEILIPDGDYFVLLCTIKPKEVFVGDENDYFSKERKALWDVFNDEESYQEGPNISYYRLQVKKIIDHRHKILLVETLVPIISSQDLNKERVRFYQEQYRQGVIPTAFSIAIWDQKAPDAYGSNNTMHPNYDPDVRGHELLAHYIIDGHHKIYAASLEGKEITLLTYIRKDNYFGTQITQEEIAFLANPPKIQNLLVPQGC